MKTTTSQHGERCLWRRSWSVGIATALLAAAPFVASAQGDGTTGGENTIGTYKGAEDLPGQTFEQLWEGVTTGCPYTDASKVYFLYNVGTGKFLNMGGYWGTHVSMKDYPMPLWTSKGENFEDDKGVTRSLNFTHDMATKQGSMIKWVTQNSNPTTDTGVFCDRPKASNADGFNGWFFENAGDDGKNTYRIYTYSSSLGGSESDRLYLFAHPQGLSTADKNCGADTKKNLSQDFPNDDFSKWRVFTLQDVYNLQEENSDNLDAPLDLSFKLKCPGFERGRMDIDEWYVSASSVAPESYTRIGLEEYNWKTTTKVSDSATPLSRGNEKEDYNDGGFSSNSKSYEYSFPYSGTTAQTIKGFENYLRYMGKFFCMDVHGTHGYIYQKVFVKHAGTYVVECKGYSNTDKAHLFAGVAGKDGHGKGLFDGSRRTIMLNQVSNMPEDEKTRLHVKEQNMDYAGKEFYESNKYTNSVIVQVTQKMIDDAKAAGQEGACIAFGLYIGNPNDASEEPSADEWTVFDDFRVLYASDVNSGDLILDELRDNLDYLKDGITYKNRTLRLAKTFKRNSWNSFVLPVDLTVKQLRNAFGGTVRLAKLKALTETELQFETVNLDEDDTKIALEAYQPYIIFPVTTMEDNKGSSYTAKTGASENNKITIQGQHFEIPDVTFKMTGNKNDLSQMEANWTTKLTDKAEAITAYGTFVRTFDPEATQDETGVWSFSSRRGEIRQDYYDLKGSYFFDNGNVYFSDTKERGLRGFSCWFKPNTNNGKKPAFYLDGVEQEAELTSIGELIVGPEAANRYGKNNGVYNLQGQRVGNTTEGLPSGIYIVNGRKHVVR